MRRLIGLFCAVLGVLGLSTGVAQAARAAQHRSPGRVHALRATSRSSTSISLSWVVPTTKAHRATVVRYAAGTRAPRTAHAGHSAGRLTRSGHTLTVGRLRSGRPYAVSVFAIGSHGRSGPRVSTVVSVAPAPATNVRSFAVRAGTDLAWTNPRTRSFSRVVVRVAKGAAAPAGPSRGRAVRVSTARATGAVVSGLARGTTYAVSVFALDRRGGYSTPSVTRFTTSAGAAANGTLTGVVQDSTGHALTGVQVEADGDMTATSATGLTGSDGSFRLSLPADHYTVFIGGGDIGGGSSTTGYVATIEDATVGSGVRAALPVVQLDPGAAVTGRVVDAEGRPLSGAYAYAAAVDRYLTPDSDGFVTFFSGFGADGQRPSADDGTYTVLGVPTTGAVRVCASPPDSQHSRACADRALLLTPGTVTTVPDLVLPAGRGGTVAGTVRSSSGASIRNSFVYLEGTDDDVFLGAPTDSAGRYDIDSVPPGDYRVCAQSYEVSAAHPTGFAPGCSTHAVDVTAGGRATLDLALATGAAVTGTVTGPTGRPVTGAGVIVQRKDAGAYSSTDAHGQYTVTGLPAGSFSVCFATDGATSAGAPSGVAPACWNSHPTLSLTAGRIRSGIDKKLGRGGAISGTARTADGKPAAGVEVGASSVSQDEDDGDGPGGGTETDAAGRYTIRGLPTGRYGVCFDAVTAGGSENETCGRSPVSVRVGRTVTGVDGRLPAVSAIAVSVVDGDGTPVAGVDAVALSSCPDECDPQPLFDEHAGVSVDASQATDSTGSAVLDGLSPGLYAVCLYAFNGATGASAPPTGYADSCNGSTFSVTVVRGQTTSITRVLSPGGAVSGTVVDGSGGGDVPVAGVRALVSHSAATDFADDNDFEDDDGGTDDDSSPAEYGSSAPDGTFTVIGVQPGTQTVCFDASSATGGASVGGYLDTCTHSAGTAVTVTAGGVSSVGTVRLTAAGAITGSVRHNGKAVGSARVYVFDKTSVHDAVAGTATTSDGRFVVDRLAAGVYTVCVVARGLDAQCWRGVDWDTSNDPPLDKATPISVGAGAATGGIDVVLT